MSDLTPVDYALTARYHDWSQGRRDARAGIPAVTEKDDPRPVTTPHREALIRLAEDVFGAEYLRYLDTVADPHRRITAARAELEVCRANLVWAEAQVTVASEPPPLAELHRRRYGEQDQPEEVIVQRRTRDHVRDVQRARQTVSRAQEAAEQAEGVLAEALKEAEQHHAAAVARVHRFHAHTHRRLSVYRRSLVRRHSDGAWVNAALSPARPELPSWAVAGAHDPDVQAPPAPMQEPQPKPVVPPQREGRELKLDLPYTVFGSSAVEATATARRGFVALDSPLAAAHHFNLRKDGAELVLRSNGQGNGPYIDGGQVITAVRLRPGDRFDFGDERYIMQDVDTLWVQPLGEFRLVVADAYAVTGDKARLTGMSFVQHANTVLAVLGPSGAGKSSTFQALLGELPLQSGSLYFREMVMRGDAPQFRERMGFVPQDVLLHETLTVRKVLEYAFRLRSAAPLARFEKRLKEIAEQLQLNDQLPQVVKTLSGGQKRRVSLAIELVTDPELLMLDEPTTGLDTGLDRDVMRILRDLAHEGKLVIIVTHALEHLHLAHQVLVVVTEGRPVYSGEPQYMLSTLGQDSNADMMRMLATDPDEHVRRYAGNRAKEAIEKAKELAGRPLKIPARTSQRGKVFLRQLRTLLTRQLALLLARGRPGVRDPGLLLRARGAAISAMPLLIAVASAAVAALVPKAPGLGEPGPNTGLVALNLLTTLCVLSGQALTYSDLISEAAVVQREHRTGVSSLAVTTAKWLVYAVVAIAQALIITLVFCAFPDRAPSRGLLFGPVPDLMISLCALTVASMSLGLLISTVARTLEQAMPLVTIVTITQIAFNGASSDLSQSNSIGLFSLLLPDRWGLAAAAAASDLRGINRPGMTQDRLWTHEFSQWMFDLAALGVLSLVFFGLATYRLHRRLNSPG